MANSAEVNTDQYNFLLTLAQGVPEGLYFQVSRKVSYLDHDSQLPRESFRTDAWLEEALEGPWYFNTGASSHHRLRRQDNLKALRAIVLDDVGTKVERDKVLAAPTWELETSPGNFQLGFMLKEWCDDIHAGDELCAGLIAAGLQDPGVRTCCRLFRVPGSLNDKPGRDNFCAVLHSFDRDIVYTLRSLAKALHVKPQELGRRHAVATPEQLPRADEPDLWFDWWMARGAVRHECSDGWWEIECPWSAEHSDGRDEAKIRPLWGSPDGSTGAMCFHTHGFKGGEYRKRLFAWVAQQGGPDLTPQAGGVKVLSSTAREVLAHMRSKGPPPGDGGGDGGDKEPGEEPAPAGPYSYITLAQALGNVPKDCLPRVEYTAEGHPRAAQPCTYDNVEAGLAFLGVTPRLDLMTGGTSYVLPERIERQRFGAMTAREVDAMIAASLTDCFHAAGLRNKKDLWDVFARIANSRMWNPAQDWILSKPWDGQDRYEALLGAVTCEDTERKRAYFRRWLLQGIEAACGWEVRRTSQKALVLVLAGKQRIGKTRFLMSLAPGYCAEGKHLSLDGFSSRDSKHEALQGMVVELGELDTTFTRSANGALKAFISQTTDEYRLPYATEWLKRPRCTSFCASVNDTEFLRDRTGNARFAVLEVERCNPAHGIDVQQLWAQVHTWWAAGEEWWLGPEEEVLQAESNEQFEQADGVHEMLAAELEKRTDRKRYVHECGIGAAQIARLLNLHFTDSVALSRISQAMAKLTGRKHRDLRKFGGGPRAWAVWLDAAEMTSTLSVKPLKPGA
jgi:putative DNA primase/helicase